MEENVNWKTTMQTGTKEQIDKNYVLKEVENCERYNFRTQLKQFQDEWEFRGVPVEN